MITINIYAYNKDILECFSITIKKDNSVISYNNLDNSITIESLQLGQFLKDYNAQDSDDGIPLEKRDFYKQLQLNKKNQHQRDLARIFAITAPRLYINYFNPYYDATIDTTVDENFSSLYNTPMYDWNGSLENQPRIYFLKKEMIDKENKAINYFFELGEIYKYEIIYNDKRTISYLHPFKNDSNKIKKYTNIWGQIIKDSNIEVKKHAK